MRKDNLLLVALVIAAIGWLVYRSGGSGAFGAEPAKDKAKAQRIAWLKEKVPEYTKALAEQEKGYQQLCAKGEGESVMAKTYESSARKLREGLPGLRVELEYLEGRLTPATAEAKVKAAEEEIKKAQAAITKMEEDSKTTMNSENYRKERRPALQKAADAAKEVADLARRDQALVQALADKGEF